MTPDEILALIESQDEHFMDLARAEVLKLYKELDLSALTSFLKGALTNPGSQAATLKTALELFDNATRKLKKTPVVISQIIRSAVDDQVLTTDQLLTALDPKFKFNQIGRERQYAERNMTRFNEFWSHETPRFRKQVYGAIKIGLRKGWSEERLAREIQDRTGVSRYRATLIATNEVQNARAYANQERQKDLGIETYVWTTQRDSRVRSSHRARDRKKYRWDGPEEKPGMAIRCRCFAKPFISADKFNEYRR